MEYNHLKYNQFMTYWKPIRHKLGDSFHTWNLKGVISKIEEYSGGALVTIERTIVN